MTAAVRSLTGRSRWRWRRPPPAGRAPGVRAAAFRWWPLPFGGAFRWPRLLAAPLVAALALWLVPPHAARAHEGEDHGGAPPAATATTGHAPQRQPDGSVFMPKPAQRQLALRTQPIAEAELPRAFELAGTVVMDPNAGGKVQAAVAGRIEPGPNGLPALGQRVRAGDLLAWVRPTSDTLERASQAAQLAELRAAQALATQRVARLQALADTVPRKDIEAAEAEAAGLAQRIAALAGGLGGRDALRAPVDGVVAATHAVAGQVVDARELVFEVVDPARLRVEALAYDPAQAADVAVASLALGERSLALKFVGAGRSLRGQALPLQFALAAGSEPAALAIGQPVRLVVQTASRTRGLPVPAAALQKGAANQTIVWVKRAPERFEPRLVTHQPLDGARVLVTTGLAAGERVVTQGAALLNQVR